MDRLRVVTFTKNRRPTTLLDINDDTNYSLVRDTFAPKPSNSQPQYAQSGRRYGGARLVNETHDNGTVEAEWYISGSSSDNALQKVETLLAVMDDISLDRWLEWRMDGASNSIFYQLRGPATWEPMYRWIETMQTHTLHLKGSWPIAPLGEGLPLDICDLFEVDSLTDFTQTAGAGTLTWSSSGVVAPTSTANKLYVHSARGYKYDDQQVTFKFTTGASGSGTARSIGAFLDASNYLFAENTGTTLRLGKRDLAAESTLGSTAAFALAANTTYWLRYRSEQNNLAAEIFTSEPSPGLAPSATATFALSGADATKFGSRVFGQAGFYLTPQATDWRVNGFAVEPYTYRARSLPENLVLHGIPGTAPARTDLVVASTVGGTATYLWGFLTGWNDADNYTANLINGDWGEGIQILGSSRWTNSITGFVTALATSFVQSASTFKFGSYGGQVVVPATAGSGIFQRVYKRFRKGTTYTFSAWVQNPTAGVTLSAGQAGTDSATTNKGTSAGFVQVSVTWTPTADRDFADIAFTNQTATGQTFFIDGAEAYEGTVAPTVQTQGRGAFSPFGILDAANAMTITASGAITADATKYRSGFGIQQTAAGQGTLGVNWSIDPNALEPDDFQGKEVSLECWARVNYPDTLISPTIVSYAVPLEAGNLDQHATSTRYTHEWGPTGKLLPIPVAGTGNQQLLVRLGTLTLPVDPDYWGRWLFHIDWNYGAASSGAFGLDYLLFVPVRQRACTPSGKNNDLTYPRFMSFTAANLEQIKTTRSDLSGRIANGVGGAGKGVFPDIGLGGQLLELPVGDVQVVNVLSNNALEPAPGSWSGNLGGISTSSVPTITGSLHYSITPRYYLGRAS